MAGCPSSALIRHVSFWLMLVQNAGFVLVMRYSRKQVAGTQHSYNVSIVVVLQELFKLVVCSLVISFGHRSASAACAALRSSPRELGRLAVPAACFTLQNNVLYVALSNLHPLTFQISYQLKTLLTAGLSVLMLRKKLSAAQWASQLLLAVGIVLTQVADSRERDDAEILAQHRNPLLGLLAVFAAASSSAFASVYFERILKGGAGGGGGSQASLWKRNTELCTWTVPMNMLLAVLQSTREQPLSEPLRGFTSSTWAVIVINGLGGLLVAVVIKYADNIWKGFATAGAIILTGLLAPVLDLGPRPNPTLLAGACLVISSIFLYAAMPVRPSLRPPAANAMLLPHNHPVEGRKVG